MFFFLKKNFISFFVLVYWGCLFSLPLYIYIYITWSSVIFFIVKSWQDVASAQHFDGRWYGMPCWPKIMLYIGKSDLKKVGILLSGIKGFAWWNINLYFFWSRPSRTFVKRDAFLFPFRLGIIRVMMTPQVMPRPWHFVEGRCPVNIVAWYSWNRCQHVIKKLFKNVDLDEIFVWEGKLSNFCGV